MGKAVGVCDALYSTIHWYSGSNTTFCVATAAIVPHSALLSTQLSIYSAVGVGTEFFSAVQALLGRLPTTAGTCAARINSAIIFLHLSQRTLSAAMRSTVGGDAEHYTFGANAAFLLLLVHVLSFTMLLGSMLFFFFSAHVRTATARYRAFTTARGDTAIYSFY